VNEHKEPHEHREPGKPEPENRRHETHEPEYREHEKPERPRRRRAGRDRKVHQEIIARRMEGGAPATPEAYAKALEQWHQLPGSVVRPPSDLGAANETNPAPANEAGDKESRS
jgi:hypothetical protein